MRAVALTMECKELVFDYRVFEQIISLVYATA